MLPPITACYKFFIFKTARERQKNIPKYIALQGVSSWVIPRFFSHWWWCREWRDGSDNRWHLYVILCFVNRGIKLGFGGVIPNQRQYLGIPFMRRFFNPMVKYVECDKPYAFTRVLGFSSEFFSCQKLPVVLRLLWSGRYALIFREFLWLLTFLNVKNTSNCWWISSRICLFANLSGRTTNRRKSR